MERTNVSPVHHIYSKSVPYDSHAYTAGRPRQIGGPYFRGKSMAMTNRMRCLVYVLGFTLLFSTAVNVISLTVTLSESPQLPDAARRVEPFSAGGARPPVPLAPSPTRPPPPPQVQTNRSHHPDSMLGTLQALKHRVRQSDFKESEQNSDDKKLLQQILRDETLNTKDNIDNLIRLGRVLEDYVSPRRSAEFQNPPETSRKRTYRKVVESRSDHGGVDTEKPLPENAYSKLKAIVRSMEKGHEKQLEQRRKPLTLRVHLGKESEMSSAELYHNHITQFALYSDTDPVIDKLLSDLSALDIVGLETMPDYGTQIKLVFRLSDGSKALFKPMRFGREVETLPDHFYFADYERHTAETAAFHLDRLFGFNRVPPVAGRIVDITRDIQRFAPKSLNKTIYISPAKNKCFYGKCDYYCDSGHPVCGTPVLLEGSMAAWLPPGRLGSKKAWPNPWARSYSKFDVEDWETDPFYCETIRVKAPYNSGRRLLDVMDMTVFDFLQGNMDRHHYHTLKVFGNYTTPFLYDNGRGFGKTLNDELSILEPVKQCCLVRYSTLRSLLAFRRGPKHLSDAMRTSLSRDKLTANTPILTEPHLAALDRRVDIILKTLNECVREKGVRGVVADDGF